MDKSSGYFIVLDGETYEKAVKEHFVAYESMEHAKLDAPTFLDDGTKFEIYYENKSVGCFIVEKSSSKVND